MSHAKHTVIFVPNLGHMVLMRYSIHENIVIPVICSIPMSLYIGYRQLCLFGTVHASNIVDTFDIFSSFDIHEIKDIQDLHKTTWCFNARTCCGKNRDSNVTDVY